MPLQTCAPFRTRAPLGTRAPLRTRAPLQPRAVFPAMLESAELNFNADHGYLEGLVRGCKAGLLTRRDYVNLVQCENLEGKRRSCVSRFSRVRLSATP